MLCAKFLTCYPRGEFRLRFDVEKALKNVRIFRRQIDVDISTVFIRGRKNVEKALKIDVDSTSIGHIMIKSFQCEWNTIAIKLLLQVIRFGLFKAAM